MRARLAIALVLLLAVPAAAAEWGLIRPGVSTTDDVRARYGAATRVMREKIEGHDTESWIYEGTAAPTGIVRLTVDFGIVLSDRYRPNVVRAFRLEPKPETFNRGIISSGWGYPDRMWLEDEEERFLYKDGLYVQFDKKGWNARLLMFTVPQPRDPTEDERR